MDRTELVELIDQVLSNSDGSPGIAGRIADCVMHKYILIHQNSPDDIQFRIPDVHFGCEMPKGTIFALPPRRADESDEQYGTRCVKIVNIGDSK